MCPARKRFATENRHCYTLDAHGMWATPCMSIPREHAVSRVAMTHAAKAWRVGPCYVRSSHSVVRHARVRNHARCTIVCWCTQVQLTSCHTQHRCCWSPNIHIAKLQIPSAWGVLSDGYWASQLVCISLHLYIYMNIWVIIYIYIYICTCLDNVMSCMYISVYIYIYIQSISIVISRCVYTYRYIYRERDVACSLCRYTYVIRCVIVLYIRLNISRSICLSIFIDLPIYVSLAIALHFSLSLSIYIYMYICIYICSSNIKWLDIYIALLRPPTHTR